MAWGKDEDERLRKCVFDGMSFGEMMRLFPGKTRNALIGRAHRIGLKGAGRPKAADDIEPKPKPVKRSPRPRFQMLPDPEPEVAEPLGLLPANYVPEAAMDIMGEPIEPAPAGGVLLDDLKSHHCRWPINNGNPFRFCGAPKDDVSSYCAHHHKLSFRKPNRGERKWVKPKISAFKFRAS